MKAYLVTDIKAFMRALLSDSLFAQWQLRSAEISVLNTITLDGKVNPDYLNDEEKAARTSPYLTWEEIQPKVRALISRGSTPTMMNIILAMDPARFKGMPEGAVESLLLNIRYEMVNPSDLPEGMPQTPGSAPNRRLSLITGVSMKSFSLDKTPERMWDEAIPTFFARHDMPLTEI